MRSHLRVLGKLLFLVLALSLTECSKNKKKSQQVDISVKPEKPIVFTSDFTYTSRSGNQVTVKGPWFSYQVKLDNQSDTPLTVIALHIEITGVDQNGTFTTNSIDYVPGTDNTKTDVQTCMYEDFGEFEAYGNTGSSGFLFEQPTAASSSTCTTGEILFYAGSNPKPDQTSFIRYTVKVQPQGYFGVRGDPKDRFENFKTIFTQ